jgi:hypothetical protein
MVTKATVYNQSANPIYEIDNVDKVYTEAGSLVVQTFIRDGYARGKIIFAPGQWARVETEYLGDSIDYKHGGGHE